MPAGVKCPIADIFCLLTEPTDYRSSSQEIFTECMMSVDMQVIFGNILTKKVGNRSGLGLIKYYKLDVMRLELNDLGLSRLFVL